MSKVKCRIKTGNFIVNDQRKGPGEEIEISEKDYEIFKSKLDLMHKTRSKRAEKAGDPVVNTPDDGKQSG